MMTIGALQQGWADWAGPVPPGPLILRPRPAGPPELVLFANQHFSAPLRAQPRPAPVTTDRPPIDRYEIIYTRLHRLGRTAYSF